MKWPFPSLFYIVGDFTKLPLKADHENLPAPTYKHKALLQIFPSICYLKRSKILQWLRARGHLQSGMSQRCFAEALSLHTGCPWRLQHLFLHIPAGFCCLQSLSKASQESAGTSLVRKQESPECGSWPHKCEDVQSPSRDSHFPFHITTSLMSRGNPLSLGTVAENGPLKFMWHG